MIIETPKINGTHKERVKFFEDLIDIERFKPTTNSGKEANEKIFNSKVWCCYKCLHGIREPENFVVIREKRIYKCTEIVSDTYMHKHC